MTLIETASATTTLPALKEEQAQKFVLTLSCKEQAGIMQAVTTFLFERGFNIDEHQQFDDSLRETLHLRTAFSGSPDFTPAMLEDEFASIASRFDMKFGFHDQTKQRVLVMVSKFGHCLNDLIFRWRGGSLGGELVAVVSNHETHRAMAEAAGLPFIYVPVTPDTKADAERRLKTLGPPQVGSDQAVCRKVEAIHFVAGQRKLQVRSRVPERHDRPGAVTILPLSGRR